jgi:hypothetical protein
MSVLLTLLNLQTYIGVFVAHDIDTIFGAESDARCTLPTIVCFALGRQFTIVHRVRFFCDAVVSEPVGLLSNANAAASIPSEPGRVRDSNSGETHSERRRHDITFPPV